MREIIILAGGKGSRIQHILPNLPKCLAPIHGKSFLHYQIKYLLAAGIEHFIFSLGYLHEQVIEFLNINYPLLHRTIIIEDKPLGTGGAIAKCLSVIEESKVFITNGDTFFEADLEQMEHLFENQKADLVLASTEIENPHRFGSLEFNPQFRIIQFHEKQLIHRAFINAGFYLLSKSSFLEVTQPESFSFEKQILEKQLKNWLIFTAPMQKLFIDIGIPEDYTLAQKLLADK